jgi:hypothetical protein
VTPLNPSRQPPSLPRAPGGRSDWAEIGASAVADAVCDHVHSNARTVSGAIRPNASVASRGFHAWQHETQRRCVALPLERRRGPRGSPAGTGARGFARRLGTSSAPAQRGVSRVANGLLRRKGAACWNREGTSERARECPHVTAVYNIDKPNPAFAGISAKPSDGLEPSTPSLPWESRGNRSQPAATVCAYLSPFRDACVCHRLPPVATARLHKCSIPA